MLKKISVVMICTALVFTLLQHAVIKTTVLGAADVINEEIKLLFSFPFDDEAEQGKLFTVASSSEIEWIQQEGVGRDDDAALRVSHISGKSYTSADNAVRLVLDEPLPSGGVYIISAWFYAPEEENQGKNMLTGPGIVLNADYAGSTGESKFPGDFGTLPVGAWKEVEVTLPVRETPLNSIDFRIVENNSEKHPDVWFLDNIEIRQLGELVEVEVPEWDITLVSMSEAYSDYFSIGNIMELNQIGDAGTSEMFRRYYNVVTFENSMKPVYMTSAKGVYNFSNSDALVRWAEENGIEVHGHTLVWHSQSALWLTTDDDGNPLTREEAKANMEEYINTVSRHYAGKVASWDVVNEAFMTSVPGVTSWRDALRSDEALPEGSPWYQAYANGADSSKGESGEDYIYDAFVFARLADPDAVLYYNDFNETQAGKREAIAAMVEELNTLWKGDANNVDTDRPLIEGIGMQAHYWTGDLAIADVEASIERFIRTGAEVSISELDIPHGTYSTYRTRTAAPNESEELLQADLYRQLFELFLKHADSISRVTFWGKADPQSWRSEGYPLLFDKTFSPKESYWAIMNTVNEFSPPTPISVSDGQIQYGESEVVAESTEDGVSISRVFVISVAISVVILCAGLVIFFLIFSKRRR